MLSKNDTNFHVIILILSLFVLNLLQASLMDLSHDEAYYWIYSLAPDWGYYDHPPMVGWMISLFGLLGKNETLVRLPFAIMQAGTLALLWDLAEKRSPWVFVFSVLSFPLILGAGFLALPDTPVLFFSALFWWASLRYLKFDRKKDALLCALAITCMFYSKYHSIVIVVLSALSMPEVFKRKSFYAIIGLCVLFYLPHVLWQYEHDFISIVFHLTGRSEKHFDFSNILNFLGGQVALGGLLAFLPAIYFAIKGKNKSKLLFYNSIGFFVFIFFLSFRNKIEANWTVTAFAALIPLICQAAPNQKSQRLLVILLVPSALLLFGVRVALMLPYSEGEYPTPRLSEVKNWKQKSDEIFQAAGDYALAADTYQMAAKLSFYGKEFVPSLALGSRKSQFSLMDGLIRWENDDKLSYVGDKKTSDSIKVEDSYSGPFYIMRGLLFRDIKKAYE